ncbi:hypothetical protein [Thermophilibacter sp.]
MSGKSDIRMYVEHLFEGRTLDAETIELKEEIYGNLVARFDDYVARGMSEDEAYARTCEAVTSVDDVMGAGRDAGGEKDAGSDETVARPAVAEAAPGPVGAAAPPPAEPARRRWSVGRVVAVVAGALVVVAVASAVAFGVFGRGATQQTSEDVTQVTAPSATTGSGTGTGTQGGTGTANQGGTSGDGSNGSNSGGTGTQGGAGNGNGYGYGAQGATGLDAEVYAHDVSTLSPYAGMGASDGRFLEMMQSLPLGAYVTSAQGDAATGTLDLAYAYDNRDALAYDDDCVDRALVYDVVAAMAVSPEVSTVRVVEEETNPYDYDRDLRVFRRASVERILGLTLGTDQLTADQWGILRDQVMGTHAWDAIWESSDVD